MGPPVQFLWKAVSSVEESGLMGNLQLHGRAGRMSNNVLRQQHR